MKVVLLATMWGYIGETSEFNDSPVWQITTFLLFRIKETTLKEGKPKEYQEKEKDNPKI